VELRVLRELRGECFLGMGEGGSVPSAPLWYNLFYPMHPPIRKSLNFII